VTALGDPEPSAEPRPAVGVVMGSDSDWPVLRAAAEVLVQFGVTHEARVVSAHRTPTDMLDYGRTARERGLQVVIAGAGGAAHLPGMLAAATTLPVVGVPIENGALRGMDALLSIAQMPAGVPVATMAINGARNAGLTAVRILALADPDLAERLVRFQQDLAAQSRAKTLEP
jgi:5-(carboxyamino)imidazole ribonucleotide mutase